MMTIQAEKFTPEVLLSAPRRSPGVPNATGELVLYTVSLRFVGWLVGLLELRREKRLSIETRDGLDVSHHGVCR